MSIREKCHFENIAHHVKLQYYQWLCSLTRLTFVSAQIFLEFIPSTNLQWKRFNWKSSTFPRAFPYANRRRNLTYMHAGSNPTPPVSHWTRRTWRDS